jgi:hypothetical protein
LAVGFRLAVSTDVSQFGSLVSKSRFLFSLYVSKGLQRQVFCFVAVSFRFNAGLKQFQRLSGVYRPLDERRNLPSFMTGKWLLLKTSANKQ